MVVPVDPKEHGYFLAFLFRIRFDAVVGQAFHNDPQGVMADFGLTQQEKDLVMALDPPDGLTPGQRAAKWAELVSCLLPEFYEWTYDHNPPLWW